ncbi:phosphatase PAP2 family protein [Piscibacillus salipiscarius]|nr:phosphatase PAP2 family protein [Piscibacillus salipiscarius]
MYNRYKWRIFYFAVAIIGIGLLTRVLKHVFERERPNIFEQYDGTGFSFPSGHSTGPMVFYGFLIYLVIRSRMNDALKWALGIMLALLIFGIGFSRIYLGVHFATDV